MSSKKVTVCGCGVECFNEWDLKRHLSYHERVKSADSSFWEKAWAQAQLDIDRIEGADRIKLDELYDAQQICREKGKLDGNGKAMAAPKPVAKKPALPKRTAQEIKRGKDVAAAQGMSKKRPPQPTGKPYWDSKHGKWTDNQKYKPKGMPSTEFGPGATRKANAMKKGKAKKPAATKSDRLSELDKAGDGDKEGD